MAKKTFKQLMARQFGGVEQVLERVEYLRRLSERVMPLVDPDIAPYCELANFRAGSLIFVVDSGVWATRLRYTFPDLLNRLRFEARLFDVANLQCVVRKHSPTRQKPAVTRPALQMSEENASLFEALAEQETDPLLAAALKRLAARVGK